jgi:transposase-like protein
MTKRKRFTAEFKREAVRLLETSQKQPSDLARGSDHGVASLPLTFVIRSRHFSE